MNKIKLHHPRYYWNRSKLILLLARHGWFRYVYRRNYVKPKFTESNFAVAMLDMDESDPFYLRETKNIRTIYDKEGDIIGYQLINERWRRSRLG